jgi:hypothetical protein
MRYAFGDFDNGEQKVADVGVAKLWFFFFEKINLDIF